MGKYKFSDQDILNIRTRHAKGESLRSLSKEFGVSEGHLSLIVRGKTRRDVGGPVRDEKGNVTYLEPFRELEDWEIELARMLRRLNVPVSTIAALLSVQETVIRRVTW